MTHQHRHTPLGRGVAPFFLEPLGQGIPADLVNSRGSSHGGAFLIGCQHLICETLQVLTGWRVRERGAAVFTAKALKARRGLTKPGSPMRSGRQDR